jgi:hypothetical protein
MTNHLEDHRHAFIDDNNKVIAVLVFDQSGHDDEILDQSKELLNAADVICCCTHGNAYIDGYWRNGEFTFPQPYPSWTYDDVTKEWNAPVPMPTDAVYTWNEEQLEWEYLIALPTE